MSSSSAAVVTPPAPAPASTPAGRPAVEARPAGRLANMDTPQRLRLLSLGVVVLSILTGIIGAAVFGYLAYSLSRAEDDAAQLIRVQQIQTNLLSADATATNAFLVGGLEPAAQRAAYDTALSTTSTLIADAARAQPADADALSALNLRVVTYAAAIEQARANNRQGLPVGAQYLRTASAQLRSSTLPILTNLVNANSARATDEMDVRVGYLALVFLLVGLAGLVLAQVWVARRFHRRVNTGLLGAAAVLLVALVAALIGVQQLSSAVRATRDGSFTALNNAASARIQANDAKSNESLTLIARGSGQAFEKAWSASSELVTTELGTLGGQSGLTGQWQAYTEVHAKIRALDDGGQWDAAVFGATSTAANSSNSTFAAFDGALAGYLDGVSTQTSTALSGQQPGLVVGAILVLLAGLAAAVLGRLGVAQRLREYR